MDTHIAFNALTQPITKLHTHA